MDTSNSLYVFPKPPHPPDLGGLQGGCLPFGKVLLEEKAQSAWVTPYKFNCKELDAESSLYYYGARYYDPKMAVFLGVDPMSDKYPAWSPFTYTLDNPIILTDPDGMKVVPAGDAETTAWEEFKTLIYSDNKKYGQVQKEVEKMEKAEEIFKIRMGENVSSDNGGGNFSYNKETKEFDVNINNNGDFSTNSKLSHEMKHGYQYLERKIGFDTKTSGILANGLAIDRRDEYEAYDRQGLFGKTLSHSEIDNLHSSLDLFKDNLMIKDIKSPSFDNMELINANLKSNSLPPRFIFHL